MRVKRDNDVLVITLNVLEGRFLVQILGRIAEIYRSQPGSLSTPVSEVLYSTKGCAAEAAPDEIKEWAEQLHGFKAARLALIEDWLRQLQPEGSLRVRLRVKVDDAPAFVGTIKDDRLVAAAEHQVGEEEMSFRSPAEMASLPDGRQGALLEIHFLAWIIEEVLREMEPV